MAVVAIGGMLLASCLAKEPPVSCLFLAGVHSETSLCRAGLGCQHASEASSWPVPSRLALAPGLLADVFKNGLLELVCAGFLSSL